MVEDSNTIKYAVGAAAALFMGYLAYRSVSSSAPASSNAITYE